jgi:hypothetical protein
MALAAYVARRRALTIDAASLDVFLPLLGELEEIRVEVSSGGLAAITQAHGYRVDSARRIVEPRGDGLVDIARPMLVLGVPFGDPSAQVTPIYIAAQLQLVSPCLAVRYVLDTNVQFRPKNSPRYVITVVH